MSDLIRREDAIITLRDRFCGDCKPCAKCDVCDTDTLIRDLVEVPPVDAVEEVELALDRQEPMTPEEVNSNMYGSTIGFCGACRSVVTVDMRYCVQCGQKINWEVDD